MGSMYAIYGNIYHQYTPNVSIYTIHGSYGYCYCHTTRSTRRGSLWASTRPSERVSYATYGPMDPHGALRFPAVVFRACGLQLLHQDKLQPSRAKATWLLGPQRFNLVERRRWNAHNSNDFGWSGQFLIAGVSLRHHDVSGATLSCQYRSRNRSPHSHFWCAAVFLRVLEFLPEMSTRRKCNRLEMETVNISESLYFFPDGVRLFRWQNSPRTILYYTVVQTF